MTPTLRIIRRAAFAIALAVVATPALAHADPVSAIATVFVAALGEGAAIAVATFVVNSALYSGVSATRARLFGKGYES